MKHPEHAFQYRMNQCSLCQLYFLDIRYPQQRELVLYDIQVAKEQIMNLKAHLLRKIRQEQAKSDVLDKMTSSQTLLTMDWAMKFLPSQFRESQQDWYAKKGVSWHVSAVVTKTANEEFEVSTITCPFANPYCQSTSQFCCVQSWIRISIERKCKVQ